MIHRILQRPIVAVAAVTVVAAVALALLTARHEGGGDVSQADREVDPDAPRGPRVFLEVPPAGDVRADFVGGQPVFVVHDQVGVVHVLDAVSPHSPPDFRKVLAWCRTSEQFEDLWHGSRFDWNGTWLGGPAPTGLARYVVTWSGSDQVLVGERQPPPPRRSDHAEPRVDDEPCDERTALYSATNPGDPAVLADVVVHTAPLGAELWSPTPERILGQVQTHPE